MADLFGGGGYGFYGTIPPKQGIMQTSSTQKAPLGFRLPFKDGRVFVYAKNGSNALTAGQLCVAATPVANHLNISVASAVAVGAKKVTVTLGATAATENQYAEGYLVCNDEAPEGILYKIKSHPAADASSSLTLTLYDEVIEAMTTSSEVCLLKHPYDSVVVSATDQADLPVGVPIVDVAANYYFWLQTWGIAPVLGDATTPAAGDLVTISAATAGAVGARDAYTEPIVGTAHIAVTSGEYRSVFLTLAP